MRVMNAVLSMSMEIQRIKEVHRGLVDIPSVRINPLTKSKAIVKPTGRMTLAEGTPENRPTAVAATGIALTLPEARTKTREAPPADLETIALPVLKTLATTIFRVRAIVTAGDVCRLLLGGLRCTLSGYLTTLFGETVTFDVSGLSACKIRL